MVIANLSCDNLEKWMSNLSNRSFFVSNDKTNFIGLIRMNPSKPFKRPSGLPSWGEEFDRVSKLIFKWLGWCFSISALNILTTIQSNPILYVFLGFVVILLFADIMIQSCKFRFINSHNQERFTKASIIVGFLLTGILYFAVINIFTLQNLKSLIKQ